MQFMADKPDGCYPLAIVDPPYSEMCNLHGGSSKNMTHGWGGLWVLEKHEQWNKRPDDKYFKKLFKISINQIIWGGNYFVEDLQNSSCWIIWDKGQRNFSLADAELAWTSFDKPARVFEYSRARSNQTDRIHITQKPVSLYLWLLTNYAKQGDKILDTHMGSGSSVIACHDLHFDYMAFELDTDYYNAAMKRINDHKAQQRFI